MEGKLLGVVKANCRSNAFEASESSEDVVVDLGGAVVNYIDLRNFASSFCSRFSQALRELLWGFSSSRDAIPVHHRGAVLPPLLLGEKSH